MNKLPLEKRIQILSMLCEGSSMRSISRIVGVSINTVTKLLVDAGNACAEFHNSTVRNLTSKRIQCDEIWSFCYAKDKNTSTISDDIKGAGDAWTWTAIDPDTKLIVSWLVGNRDADTANEFMKDLQSRISNRVQLTSDGYKVYLEAVEENFGSDIDFAMLVKMYGSLPHDKRHQYIGAQKEVITGKPDPKHISTSLVERQNLTMRMSMRRFTRKTNAFSKKLENHCHALALYFVWYNFVRMHKTLRTTPAMAADLTDKLWEFVDLINLVK